MWFEAFLKDEDFFHDYQPIISLKEWTLIGYEALLGQIFSRARKPHLIWLKEEKSYMSWIRGPFIKLYQLSIK